MTADLMEEKRKKERGRSQFKMPIKWQFVCSASATSDEGLPACLPSAAANAAVAVVVASLK